LWTIIIFYTHIPSPWQGECEEAGDISISMCVVNSGTSWQSKFQKEQRNLTKSRRVPCCCFLAEFHCANTLLYEIHCRLLIGNNYTHLAPPLHLHDRLGRSKKVCNEVGEIMAILIAQRLGEVNIG